MPLNYFPFAFLCHSLHTERTPFFLQLTFYLKYTSLGEIHWPFKIYFKSIVALVPLLLFIPRCLQSYLILLFLAYLIIQPIIPTLLLNYIYHLTTS
jgi:hypothetical protein